jgi:hypothetical protein
MADGIDPGSPLARRGAQVFISHSGKDAVLVDWIVKQVEATGNRAWVAEWELEPGGRISQKVESALRQSDAYVLLLTENGFASTYVQHEVGAAVISGKLVIALVDSDLADRPMGMLADIEQVRFQRDDLEASTAAIAAGLTRLRNASGLGRSAPIVTVPTPQSLFKLRGELTVDINFTSDDVVLGVCAVALILGILYLTKGDGVT